MSKPWQGKTSTTARLRTLRHSLPVDFPEYCTASPPDYRQDSLFPISPRVRSRAVESLAHPSNYAPAYQPYSLSTQPRVLLSIALFLRVYGALGIGSYRPQSS